MQGQWERLKGKIYPDRLAEQLTALETDETLVSYKKQREQMAKDPYRPIYHMSSLSSMGDPNGLCQWQGRYHLFYQFGPEGSNRCHWGHCYADDLVHWRDLPPALYPDTELHCFSGQTLVEDERVIAIYHGKESGNSTATATDPLLLNWEKHPDNPVIPNLKTDEYERPYNVFDPCIWKEEDGYYSISGTSIDGYIRERRRSASHLFYSKDLSQWKYLHPLLIDDVFCDLGEDGAVPNFLPIGHGKHILLLFSHKRAARYYIGEYDRGTHRFTPEYHGRINHGPFGGGHVACPSATIDSNGRCITILNCADGRQGPQSEWGRCMTLPWQLSLQEDTMLAIEPVDEVKSLRYNHDRFADIALSANEERVLDSVGGRAIELDLTVEMGTAREVGVYVLRSPNGRERTKISIYNHGHPKTNDSLQIDTSHASLRTDLVGKPPETAPFYVGTDRRIRLRAFIDRSLIEVFADNGECKAEWAFPRKGIDKIFPLFSRQCAVARAYPEREDSNGISLFSIGGEAQIVSLDVWQMRSIWPELKYQEGT